MKIARRGFADCNERKKNLNMNSKFYDLYMNDKASIDELDDFLEMYDKSTSTQSIEDYLGLTREQYFMWCKNPRDLKVELDRIKNQQ